MQYIEVTFEQAFGNDYLLYAGYIGSGQVRVNCRIHDVSYQAVLNDVYNYDVYKKYDRGDNMPTTPAEEEEFR